MPCMPVQRKIADCRGSASACNEPELHVVHVTSLCKPGGRAPAIAPMTSDDWEGLHCQRCRGAHMSLPEGRVRSRVARRPQGVARRGEGDDPGARRAQHEAARAADGRDRQGLRVRRPRGEGRACSTCSTAGASSSCSTSCSIRAGTKAARAARRHPTRSRAGLLAHLHARDTTFVVVVARAARQDRAVQGQRGWTFPWYSSYGSDFNYDFHVTIDASVAPVMWNYRTLDELEHVGMGWLGEGSSEQPGYSMFLRDGDTSLPHVLHVRPRHRDARRLVLLPRPHRARPSGGVGGAEGTRGRAHAPALPDFST